MPKSSTPALLLMQVSSLTPFSFSAAIQFSGMPQRPKPPNMMVAPLSISSTASAALLYILLIMLGLVRHLFL